MNITAVIALSAAGLQALTGLLSLPSRPPTDTQRNTRTLPVQSERQCTGVLPIVLAFHREPG
jgi:hypothetical protein